MSKFDPSVMDDALVRAAIESIQKDYEGQDDIFGYPGMDGPICAVPSVPTGSLSLDLATGVGGIPKGRLTIIAGDPSTGKSTLCLEIIKNEQRLEPEKLNIYMDLETGAFTDLYAKGMGVDLDPNKFLVIKPDYLQQGMEACYRLISTGKIGVCIWDSIAGAASKESVGKSIEESESMAMKARLLSDHLGKIATKCGKTGTALVLVNQVRTQMGTGFSWTDISGGKAQKYFASLRIDLTIEAKNKIKDFKSGVESQTITSYVQKNKVGSPYRMAEFDIMFGKGILREANILSIGAEYNLVGLKGGGNYTFYDFETGEVLDTSRGKPAAIDFLIEHPEYTAQLESNVLGMIRVTDYCQEEIDESEATTNGHIDASLDEKEHDPSDDVLEDNLISFVGTAIDG